MGRENRMNIRTIVTIPAILILALCLLAPGCGKKGWPTSRAQKEGFSFANTVGTMQNGCLVINSDLKGKYANLDNLTLELAETSDTSECRGCPFHPTKRAEYPLDAKNLARDDNHITLTHCDLEPGVAYRWRLVGRNIFTDLGSALSPVRIAAPQ